MTAELYEKLTKIRRDIHQHPEVSEREFNTTEFLKNHLSNLGIRIVETGLKTGFIAELAKVSQLLRFELILMLCRFEKPIRLITQVKTVQCMRVDTIFTKQVYWEQLNY